MKPDTSFIEFYLRYIRDEVAKNFLDLKLKVLVLSSTFITGGCFKSLYHGQKVNDFDFYFKDQNSAETFIKLIENGLQNPTPFTNREKLRLTFKSKSPFAMTFLLNKNIKIQFITKYYGTPENVVNAFDFEHCQNYYDLATDTFKYKKALFDKKLAFNSSATHPINALKRMLKFVRQGWQIDDEQLMNMAVTISKLDLSNAEVLQEQSAGMYNKGSEALDSELAELFAGNNIQAYLPQKNKSRRLTRRKSFGIP